MKELALSASVQEEDFVVGRKVGIALAGPRVAFSCDLQPLGVVVRFGLFNYHPFHEPSAWQCWR